MIPSLQGYLSKRVMTDAVGTSVVARGQPGGRAHETTRTRRWIMTHVASQFTYRIALTVTAALLLATLAHAQAQPSHAQRVEARITELHAKLHITSAQEDLWQHVTQVVRDNAMRMDELTQARAAKAPTMTAVDALKAYS